MLSPINNSIHTKQKYNFKKQIQQKKIHNDWYFIGDKKKRMKGYALTGLFAAVGLPLIYNTQLQNKPTSQSLKDFNKKFALITSLLFILPFAAIVFFQERENYLYNKQKQNRNMLNTGIDTFSKVSQILTKETH